LKTTFVYSTKAEKYARYRWDYASAAVREIFERAALTLDSVVADIGAGTGILTKHFVGRVKQVYAVEPNPEMRLQAARLLQAELSCAVLDGGAEAIPLPDASVDLITAAQAIHWFDPEPARGEVRRVLKPGGWLAILRNTSTDAELGKALGDLSKPEFGVNVEIDRQRPAGRPLEFYFGGAGFERLIFPFATRQDWPAFIGALLSASYMPDGDHPLYPCLEAAARQVFERFSRNSWLETHGETELCIGLISRK
jgi:SAM-dependent methyltransferase